MNSIKILANGVYLPQKKVLNKAIEEKLGLEENWIYKRSGIKQRYYVEKETLTDISIKAAKNVLSKVDIDIQKIGIIVVSTTSTEELMPGISFKIQKELDIKKCICLDILAGCSGYINAFDIVRKHIALGESEFGIVIGAEVLSKYTNEQDIDTAILFGDGAGATLIGKSDEYKQYITNIESIGQLGNLLTCKTNEKIYMDGKSIYKFGISKTVENINELLKKADLKIDDIKYIVPHQSNIRIMESIAKKLGVGLDKLYTNIESVGNTFCASIPIAYENIYNNIKKGDKIIFIGYGGGLNLGSILYEE